MIALAMVILLKLNLLNSNIESLRVNRILKNKLNYFSLKRDPASFLIKTFQVMCDLAANTIGLYY